MDSARFYKLLEELWQQGEMPLLIRSYSGRAMFGDRCIGVDLEGFDDIWRLAILLDRIAVAHGLDPVDLPRPRTDNMGRGAIAYWPQFEWTEEMEHLGDD